MDGPAQTRADELARPRSGGRAAKSAGAFRTISEVADELDVAQHVLRFWESKFPQVRPLKRGGGRRYYRPEDVDLLRKIRSLLYEEGYTIKGAQKLLKGQRRPNAERTDSGAKADLDAQELDLEDGADIEVADDEIEPSPISPELRRSLRMLRDELVALRETLRPDDH